ncbi:TetR/AcrR family transcriptional regulator [Paraburkholderia sp. BL21I4N1]|uniref:TetR/AcrR family transcriptional regulator n=1 Tax=Paraburkholderia sp. BL21I4N1 TaxID=1938801 RepID=UPI000CFAD48B|nr:TetR/AcrR family transcriptional regulator [Paraburkholderia sp. BL21I4N1]PQV47643.1 TetR family transcriptional regulator [Paraburkholderia sp. BL21I4N1]
MKVTKARATENREAIEKAAAALIRECGFDQISVAEVAAAAGLTHGALYSHYRSKEALTKAATSRAFEDTLSEFAGLSTAEFVHRYLSAAHRDHPEVGCPNAALVTEVWRQAAGTREAFRDGIQRYVELIAQTLETETGGKPQSKAVAVTMLATMVGAVALSRAIRDTDHACANEILRDVSAQLARFTTTDERLPDDDSPHARTACADSSEPG